MTKEQKIKVLAELDGWQPYREEEFPYRNGYERGEGGELCLEYDLPDYLYNYDAIIPLVRKQDGEIRMLVCDYCLKTLGFGCYFDATPEQLSDALIKAVGQWEE